MPSFPIPKVLWPSLWLLPLVFATSNPSSVSAVNTFPLGTWVENLAVRSNGLVLATLANVPQLWQVDPSCPGKAELIATIPNHLALSGITEVESDVFYIGANNFSLHPPSNQLNASAIYRIDLNARRSSAPVKPALVTDFSYSGLLNGFFTLSNRYILVADAGLGLVWRIDVKTSEKRAIVSDPLMRIANPQKEPIGVNGIKVQGHMLYWSNTNQELLAKIPISADGEATGAASIVTNYAAPDDFLSFRPGERFLVAGNDEVRIIEGNKVTLVSDDPLLKGSTAIAYARKPSERRKTFVSTNGGVEQYAKGNITVPGRIVELLLQCD